MRNNFLKGFQLFFEEDSFKKQMGDVLNIDPDDVAEDYLDIFVIANPVIHTSNGEKHTLKGNIQFEVVYRGKNLVTIKDISYSDSQNPKLAKVASGINASADQGDEYTMTTEDYEELIQWQIPPSQPSPPMPENPMGT